jgi:hypothetical protein
MGGIGLYDNTVTLFIKVPGGGYAVRRLTGVLFSATDGISGGDSTPARKAAMYYFDNRSHCTDPDGNKCGYISPVEWPVSDSREGVFTFDTSGGSWLCEGDLTGHIEPQFEAAYRITSVERQEVGRRRLRHFKISCE